MSLRIRRSPVTARETRSETVAADILRCDCAARRRWFYILFAERMDTFRRFAEYLGRCAIIRALLTRISDSCGYNVPQDEYASSSRFRTVPNDCCLVFGLVRARGRCRCV